MLYSLVERFQFFIYILLLFFVILKLIVNISRDVERLWNIRVRGKSWISCDSNSEFQHWSEINHEKIEVNHEKSPLCQVEEEGGWEIER